jgi:hypothetical protein
MASISDFMMQGYSIAGVGTWKTYPIQETLTQQAQIHLQIVYLQSALGCKVARQIVTDTGFDWDITDI